MILADRKSRTTETAPPLEPGGAERRRLSRAPADFSVAIESNGDQWTAWAVDIGLGGMFIETDAVPAYGSIIHVTIGAPTLPQAMRLPGIVRWSAEGGFGVEFGLLGIRETYALVGLTSEHTRFEEEAVTVMRMHLCS